MSEFYVSPAGSDARTPAQAQNPATPWKTWQFAFRNAAVVDDDKVWLGTPGAMALTWTGADACLDSRGTPNGTNMSKRVKFEVVAGCHAVFEVSHGAGIRDSNGSFIALFINPKQTSVIRGAGASLSFRDLEGAAWPADAAAENVGAAEHTSAIAFIKRSGAAGPQSGHNPLVEGVTIPHWMGNGIYFEKVDGPHARNNEVSGCATGIRANGCNGSRVSTTLAAAVAKGATSATLTAPAGINVGDMLRLDSWPVTESRIVTGISGNVAQLGGYAWPGGPLLATFPLEFAHPAGAAAVTQFGIEGNNLHHNNENTRGLGNPANGDVGGEALAFAKGSYNVAAWNNHMWRNYDDRMKTVDYGIDGTGGLDPYAMRADSNNIFAWNRSHDNHAWIESGTDQGQLAAGNDNGGLLVYRNYIWGEIDQQHLGKYPERGPTASLLLARATPKWMLRHNTSFITNGPRVGAAGSNRGGIRMRSGGQYGGARNGMVIFDNLFVYAVDSRLYDYTAADGLPTGSEHKLDYNLLHRPNGGTDPAAVKGAKSYALTQAGLASWRADTGWSQHDIWGQDPLFVDPASGDLRLKPGSPAIGAASDGSDIGAAIYLVVETELERVTRERNEALQALVAMTADRDTLKTNNGILTTQLLAANTEKGRLASIIGRSKAGNAQTGASVVAVEAVLAEAG